MIIYGNMIIDVIFLTVLKGNSSVNCNLRNYVTWSIVMVSPTLLFPKILPDNSLLQANRISVLDEMAI